MTNGNAGATQARAPAQAIGTAAYRRIATLDSVHDLRVPRDYSTNTYSNPVRYPQVRHIRLSYHSAEIVDHYGRVQVFGIKWVRTGFGVPRRVFVCSCSRGAVRLFARYGTYACKACHKALHLCQRQSSRGRKRLRACKLRLKLGGLPDVNETLAPKVKWRHRRTTSAFAGRSRR